MKKIIFIVAIILTGFIIGYYVYQKSHRIHFDHIVKEGLKFEQWIPFPPEENFSASFPQKPETITHYFSIPGEEQSLPYKEYVCETEDGKRFSISYTILPGRWLKYGKRLVLRGALKAIMKQLDKVELVGKETTIFKTFPALDYEHYGDSRETTGTLILVGNILYKVEISYPLDLRGKIQDEFANFIMNFTPNAIAPLQTNI